MMSAFLKEGNYCGSERSHCGKERNSAYKGKDVLIGILIGLFFRQKRKAYAFCAAPPEKVDYREVKNSEALAESEKIQKCRYVAVKAEYIF